MKPAFTFLLVHSVLFSFCQQSLKEDEQLLLHLMQKAPKQFQSVISHPEELEVQIIYTQINRDANNRPAFKSFFYHVDSTSYFYPASTVKLPLVLLSLEKLNQLNIKGLDKYTPMVFDSVYSGHLAVREDASSENGLASIAHYSKKILTVSDNDAFNRLYEFMGQKATNELLQQKGYNIKIIHQLARSLTPDENRHTEAIRFLQGDSLIFHQSMLVNPDSIRPARSVKKGKGFIGSRGLVHQPFDFTYKNTYPLQEQQELLKAILFPDAVEEKKRFQITAEDRSFVMQYLSQLPRETSYPPYYKDSTLYDAYCKFLLFGARREAIPDNIRIFNKVGDAYGYMIDNAYIVDFKNGVEFLLSAVINTNTDGIYNDNKYEYTRLGFPFMKNLGQLIYRYELQRNREWKPDLSGFQLQYDHR